MVLEPTTFPTDGYVAAGVARMLGLELRWCDPADPAASLDDDVALLALTHVDFRTGAMFDLPGRHRAPRTTPARWSCGTSATPTGAVPVDLADADADFAVGCTYKYLNGGPGSPAFVVGRTRGTRTPATSRSPAGWGTPARSTWTATSSPPPASPGWPSGTPPVLALSALEAALDVFDGVAMADAAGGVAVADRPASSSSSTSGSAAPSRWSRRASTPGAAARCRCATRDAYGVVQALIARGVVGDFRTPDVARFGFAPLYVTHADVFDAVDHLVAVLEDDEHLRPGVRRPQRRHLSGHGGGGHGGDGLGRRALGRGDARRTAGGAAWAPLGGFPT